MNLQETHSIIAIVQLLPEQHQETLLADLTWWALANYDESGKYIGDISTPRAILSPNAENEEKQP